MLAHTNSRYEALTRIAGSSLGHNHGPIIMTVTKNARTLSDLIRKNKKYGNSALEPIRIFSNANPVEQLKIRIDDKLSRVSQGFGEDPDEDTLLDLMGYLVLLRIAQNEQKIPDDKSYGAVAE